MAFSQKVDEVDAYETLTGLGLGRGKFLNGNLSTPNLKTSDVNRTPLLCSTRVIDQGPSSEANTLPLAIPDINDPNWQGLIAHIAQQVGQTMLTFQKEGENTNAQTPGLGSSQVLSDIPSLNLTGVKLVMQSEAKEPPVYRGDGSDKLTVHEWEEMMDTYLRKRGIPISEQHQEILCRLMSKAKDVVRVTLRCNSALNPVENPKVIIDILKQHFSDAKYSCMPLADFYSTLPLVGENPIEYWVRLNKAADLTEEALKRLGRQMDDPCQEAAMMFVKHCPDSTLAAVFRFKASEKWTAQEIQEQLDRYQAELKEQMSVRPKRSAVARHVTAHVQTSNDDNVIKQGPTTEPDGLGRVSALYPLQSDDNCMRTLVSLLDSALSQNTQSMVKQLPSRLPPGKICRVCKSHDHSTVTHCRRERLCFACFQPGHSKRDCTSGVSRPGPAVVHSQSDLNPMAHVWQGDA